MKEGFSEILEVDFVPEFANKRDEDLFKQWTAQTIQTPFATSHTFHTGFIYVVSAMCQLLYVTTVYPDTVSIVMSGLTRSCANMTNPQSLDPSEDLLPTELLLIRDVI